MTKDEALRLALEALEYPLNQSHENFNVDMAELLSHRAITAIKEALAQPEQKPVAVFDEKFGRPKMLANAPILTHGQKLYTTPPQRTWVGLTDEEKNAITWGNDIYKILELAEAKLKEKNT